MIGSILSSLASAHLGGFTGPDYLGDPDGMLLTEDCGFVGGVEVGEGGVYGVTGIGRGVVVPE